MKKLFLITTILSCNFNLDALAQTTSALSGIYQNLTLGVDPSRQEITGYYYHLDEPPNRPRSECIFFLSGRLQGDKYLVEAWQPEKRNTTVSKGELKIYTANNIAQSVWLKLEELSRDCTYIVPKLSQAEGLLLDKNKAGNWSEVRVVGNSTSYYQTPETSSPQRGNARRGLALTITSRKPGWVQVEANQKPKGWIQENDLFPLHPNQAMAEPVKIKTTSEPAPPPKTVTVAPVQAEAKPNLVQRLKALNSEAFGLALRVLANPAERSTLLSRQSELERELNSVVSDIDRQDPQAYRNESTRIYETYLDLQFVRHEQAVLSLRLRQEILKK